jgi:hypothetical protein
MESVEAGVLTKVNEMNFTYQKPEFIEADEFRKILGDCVPALRAYWQPEAQRGPTRGRPQSVARFLRKGGHLRWMHQGPSVAACKIAPTICTSKEVFEALGIEVRIPRTTNVNNAVVVTKVARLNGHSC